MPNLHPHKHNYKKLIFIPILPQSLNTLKLICFLSTYISPIKILSISAVVFFKGTAKYIVIILLYFRGFAKKK